MRRKKTNQILLLIIWLTVGLNALKAQTFITREFLPDTCNKDLFLHFESSMFFKNNEYFSPYSAGYTWPGFYIKPTLDYFITPTTRISVGYYMLKFFGEDSIFRSVPILTVQQRLTPHLNLVFGNIYGTLNHQMEEALLRFDRYIHNHVEYGIQLIYDDSTRLRSDTWLNWERFIYFNSKIQEFIQFGSSSQIKILNTGIVNLSMPIQLLIYHHGGHLAVPDHILTVADGMSGMDIKIFTSREKFLSSQALIFVYKGLNVPDTGHNYLPYKSGNAFYYKLKWSCPRFKVTLGYWQAKQFIAPEGEYLMMNISEIYRSYHEPLRKMVIGKLGFDFNLSRYVKAELNAGFYYDLIIKNLAYYYGLYFTINQPFFMGKLSRYGFSR